MEMSLTTSVNPVDSAFLCKPISEILQNLRDMQGYGEFVQTIDSLREAFSSRQTPEVANNALYASDVDHSSRKQAFPRSPMSSDDRHFAKPHYQCMYGASPNKMHAFTVEEEREAILDELHSGGNHTDEEDLRRQDEFIDLLANLPQRSGHSLASPVITTNVLPSENVPQDEDMTYSVQDSDDEDSGSSSEESDDEDSDDDHSIPRIIIDDSALEESNETVSQSGPHLDEHEERALHAACTTVASATDSSRKRKASLLPPSSDTHTAKRARSASSSLSPSPQSDVSSPVRGASRSRAGRAKSTMKRPARVLETPESDPSSASSSAPTPLFPDPDSPASTDVTVPSRSISPSSAAVVAQPTPPPGFEYTNVKGTWMHTKKNIIQCTLGDCLEETSFPRTKQSATNHLIKNHERSHPELVAQLKSKVKSSVFCPFPGCGQTVQAGNFGAHFITHYPLPNFWCHFCGTPFNIRDICRRKAHLQSCKQRKPKAQ